MNHISLFVVAVLFLVGCGASSTNDEQSESAVSSGQIGGPVYNYASLTSSSAIATDGTYGETVASGVIRPGSPAIAEISLIQSQNMPDYITRPWGSCLGLTVSPTNAEAVFITSLDVGQNGEIAYISNAATRGFEEVGDLVRWYFYADRATTVSGSCADTTSFVNYNLVLPEGWSTAEMTINSVNQSTGSFEATLSSSANISNGGWRYTQEFDNLSLKSLKAPTADQQGLLAPNISSAIERVGGRIEQD